MEITRQQECLHSAFEDGRVTFGVYLSPEVDFEDFDLNEAIAMWADGEDVYLNFRFTLEKCVDDMIDFHRLYSHKNVAMCAKDKPMVDALKQELEAALAKLNEIEFEEE